jgi:16S rRNA (uracil1498-N3)-methyltransferase
MRVTRVYVPTTLQLCAELTLSAMSSSHLIKVLRLRAGARAVLFNGDGMDYTAEIVIPKAEADVLQVLDAAPASAQESPLRIILLQGLSRGEKMDWVLEKATELGVHRIIPVVTERSEVHLDAERAAKRREHWQRVVISAAEQSGRAVVPEVEALRSLDQRLALPIDAEQKWALEPSAARFARHQHPPESIAIAVGPEGGFSERDLAQLQVAEFNTAAMGARIMRTETAGPAAIAALQALFGDFAVG